MVDDSLNKYSSDEEPVDFRVAIKHIMSKYRIPQGRLAEATDKSSSAISQVLSGIGDFKNETKRSIMYGLQHILSEEEITCDDTDRIEVSFYEQLSEDSSLGLRIQNERQQLDYFIDRGIRSAKNEIVFLGGVSHRKMSREWYAMLAERLINEPKLQIWLFLESPQNLFWRSKTLNHNIPNNSRSYEEMKNRFDLQKNEMHDAIKQFILNKFKTRADKFKQSIERLKILEVHIPIYTFITKLDEKLYITPRYHLRASKTYTELLQNGSMHYNQAKECIEFYQDLFRKKMYVSYPGEEKLVAYSDAGKIPRGELSRSSFSNDNQLETKVAHGLLFNRNGQLLLRYRSESEHDNIGLLDKSFGGNFRIGLDRSLIDTSRRELKEEIFDDMVQRLQEKLLTNDQVLEFSHPESIIFCGDWRGSEGLAPFTAIDKCNDWVFFLLSQGVQFPSKRRISASEMDIHRVVYSDIFVYICSDEFNHYIEEVSKLDDKQEVCKWIQVKELVHIDENSMTFDLKSYTRHFRKDLFEIALSIKSVWQQGFKTL